MKNHLIPEIENLTMDLLKDAYGDEVIVPPIDLEKIIKKSHLEIQLGHFNDPNIEGIFDRSKKVIYLKEGAPYTRLAFTTAHELGHFYLHLNKEQETFYRADALTLDKDKEQEQEANWFAASLLMPKEIFLEFWTMLNDLDQIAYSFGVSSTAAYWRLKNFGVV